MQVLSILFFSYTGFPAQDFNFVFFVFFFWQITCLEPSTSWLRHWASSQFSTMCHGEPLLYSKDKGSSPQHLHLSIKNASWTKFVAVVRENIVLRRAKQILPLQYLYLLSCPNNVLRWAKQMFSCDAQLGIVVLQRGNTKNPILNDLQFKKKKKTN